MLFRSEVARRVIRKDDLITIEELISDLIDKSRNQPATSIAIFSANKKPSKDNQSNPNIKGSIALKRPRLCSYYNTRHPSSKEKCFYLYLEL